MSRLTPISRNNATMIIKNNEKLGDCGKRVNPRMVVDEDGIEHVGYQYEDLKVGVELNDNDLVQLGNDKAAVLSYEMRGGIESNKSKRKTMVINDEVSDISDVELEDDEVVAQRDGMTAAVLNNTKRKRVNNQGSKVKRWCVTMNNPEKSFEEMKNMLLEKDNVLQGWIFQKEIGESGTPHFQMYLETRNQIYATGLASILETKAYHGARAVASKAINVSYCSKDTGRLEGPAWYGTCEPNFKSNQGKRTDLDLFTELIKENGGITEAVREEMPGMCMRYGRHAKEYAKDIAVDKVKAAELQYWREQLEIHKAGGNVRGQEPRELILLLGPTAVGKTTKVMLECIDKYNEVAFRKSGNDKWWDNYDGEKGVLIDEWRKELGNMEYFNQITNKGGVIVEVKGGSTVLEAETMWFAANRHPLDIFETKWSDARYRAIVRRFAEVHWWNDAGDVVVLKNPGKEPVFMGDLTDDEEEQLNAWKIKNDAWLHFWKRERVTRIVREVDENRGRDDPQFTMREVVDEDSYFTW